MKSEDQELAADAAFMRSILESSTDCIKVLGLDGSLLFMNAGGRDVMEVDDFGKIRGCYWPDFWPGTGQQQASDALFAASAGKSSYFEGPAPTAKGTPRYWEVVVSPIFDPGGRPIRILSVSRDVTSRKEIEMQRETLSRELEHRVNNTLAVVGAIVTQSLRVAATIPDAEKTISGRIRALANAHSLLTGSQIVSTTVSEVVRGAMAPYIDSEKRAEISGEEVLLNSRASVALSLTINELSTNATKYGALSNDAGRIRISWETKDQNFRLVWHEYDGPPVAQPSRTSFGTTLIKTMFGTQLRGSASMRFEPEGLVCVLEVPLLSLTQEG